MINQEEVFRLAVEVMGWNEKMSFETPFPRVSMKDGYILVEGMEGGGYYWTPRANVSEAAALLTYLPKPNVVLVDEKKGHLVFGLGWCGQWDESICNAILTAALNYLETKEQKQTKFNVTFAKATAVDLDGLNKFCEQLGSLVEWGVTDFNLEKERRQAEGMSEDQLARKIGEWVINNISLTDGFERITLGYELLIDNVCNPTPSHLEFKPELALMKACADAIKESADHI